MHPGVRKGIDWVLSVLVVCAFLAALGAIGFWGLTALERHKQAHQRELQQDLVGRTRAEARRRFADPPVFSALAPQVNPAALPETLLDYERPQFTDYHAVDAYRSRSHMVYVFSDRDGRVTRVFVGRS